MEISSNPSEEKFNVFWSNHNLSISTVLHDYFNDETYADCSLAADGEEILAHKIILSACSPYLNSMLRRYREKHPIILLHDVSKEDLYSIVEYMYKGQVEIAQHRLQSFLQLAQSLEVLGLLPADDEKVDENISRTMKRSRNEPCPEPKNKRRHVSLLPLEENDTGEEIEYLSEDDQENIKETDDYDFLFVDCVKEKEIPEDSVDVEDVEHLNIADEQSLLVVPQDIALSKPQPKSRTPRKQKKELSLASQLSRASIIPGDIYDICCETCNGIYKTKASYISHLRYDCNQVHSCSVCERIFKNKRHLLDHVRDDCGRVHVCSRCHRTFKQKVNLTTHQKHYCKPKNEFSNI